MIPKSTMISLDKEMRQVEVFMHYYVLIDHIEVVVTLMGCLVIDEDG